MDPKVRAIYIYMLSKHPNTVAIEDIMTVYYAANKKLRHRMRASHSIQTIFE